MQIENKNKEKSKKDEKEKKNSATAKLRFLKIAPRKVRKMADLIRGLKAVEAEAELLYRSQRAAGPILKLLRSAIANAQAIDLKKSDLFITEIQVDQGPMLKRSLPRAKGRATHIHKKMSHVRVVVSSNKPAKRKNKSKERKYNVSKIKVIKRQKASKKIKG